MGFEPFGSEARIGRIFHLRIVGEEIAGPVESFLSAADFFGGGFVEGYAELLEAGQVVGMLRPVVTYASLQFGMVWAGRLIAAGAFVAPRAVGFWRAEWLWDVSAPAFDGVGLGEGGNVNRRERRERRRILSRRRGGC